MENLSREIWSRDDGGEMRPKDSYFVMIGKAIVSSPRGRMALHEIYNYVRKKYPYFHKVNPTGWKNSIRHNLSLHECFIKVGKCEETKGHYWAIHPANIQDFSRGDFHRKKAKTKAKLEQTMEAALAKGLFLDYHHYSTSQWPSTTYNYHYLPSSSSNYPNGTCIGPTSDKSLKFNICNLIDTE